MIIDCGLNCHNRISATTLGNTSFRDHAKISKAMIGASDAVRKTSSSLVCDVIIWMKICERTRATNTWHIECIASCRLGINTTPSSDRSSESMFLCVATICNWTKYVTTMRHYLFDELCKFRLNLLGSAKSSVWTIILRFPMALVHGRRLLQTWTLVVGQ